MDEQKMIEAKISSEVLFEGRIIKLERDTVALSDGRESVREVIRHQGAACVVPLTDDGNVVVVRQFRYPFHRVFTELPAGKLDIGEDPHNCALRELREETGIIPQKLSYIGALYPTPAYDDEIIHMYVATGLEFTSAQPDEGEFLTVVTMPCEELLNDILSGKICDAKTQAAFLKALYLKKKYPALF